MSRSVTVVRHDCYHPESVVDPAVARVFAGPEWRLKSTHSAREVIATGTPPDLAVFFAPGREEGEDELTREEEEHLVQRVRQGMGLMRVHAGLVLIAEDGPLYRDLNTGCFVSHPRHEGTVEFPVAYAPVRNTIHPILEGIEAFAGTDEHYWCKLDAGRTDVLLTGTSAVGTSVAGWAHEVKKGRVACLVPGHKSEVIMHPMMLALLGNAARWAARR